MKVDRVRIGNSRGVRIPKPLIEQFGLGETVDLRAENDRLVIAPVRRLREGWEASFRSARDEKDRLMLEALPPNQFDCKEWNW